MNNELFQKNVDILSDVSADEAKVVPCKNVPLPSVDALKTIVELVKMIVFPGFFDQRQTNHKMRSYFIGVHMERLLCLLKTQIALALVFECDDCEEKVKRDAEMLAIQFIDRLPELKRVLYTDVEAIFADDPSTRNYSEVIFCYTGISVMIHYRIAHELINMGIPVIPRIITEHAHSITGIDIHPAATIGEYFSIHHGTGIVIGESCIIGNHVTIYQGVTLGAKNYKLSGNRDLENPEPRHPIIEDRVTIYSNSTLLGRIKIGHDTVIGGNIWITHNIPPHSKILQSKAIDVSFSDGLGI